MPRYKHRQDQTYKPIYITDKHDDSYLEFERVLVDTPEKFEEMVSEWDSSNHYMVGFDTETAPEITGGSALSVEEAVITGCSLAFSYEKGYYLPFRHRLGNNLPEELFIELGEKILYQAQIVLYWNERFDLRMQRKHGHDLSKIHPFDVSVLVWNWDINKTQPALKDAEKMVLGWNRKGFKEKFGKKYTIDMHAPTNVVDYACYDAISLLHLLRTCQDVWKEIVLPVGIDQELLLAVMDFEEQVHPIDISVIDKVAREIEPKIDEMSQKLSAFAGVSEFNPNSPQQIAKLFKAHGIDTGETTKAGQMSTDKSLLNEIKEDYPIVQDLLYYRNLRKLKSTYIDSLVEAYRKEYKGCRFSYRTSSAASGRMSSAGDKKNPYFAATNIQNVPTPDPAFYLAVSGNYLLGYDFLPLNKREDESYELDDGRVVGDDIGGIVVEGYSKDMNLRRAYTCHPGHVYVHADYSGEELRIAANLSKDEELTRVFLDGEDPHKATAVRMFGKENYDSDKRRKAKSLNFGALYGITKYSVAKRLGCTEDEAQQYLDAWWDSYPQLKLWRNKMIRLGKSKKRGYVKTAYGRRRYIYPYYEAGHVGFAQRISVNTPIQGTGADMIRIAVIKIWKHLVPKYGDDYKFLSVVHDEINSSVSKHSLVDVLIDLRKVMEVSLPGWKVPMEVGFSLGYSWGELFDFTFVGGKLVPDGEEITV